jgi:hypothetical protein
MRVRRTAMLIVVLSMLSATGARAFLVSDWLTLLEHELLRGWEESIVAVLSEEASQIQRMARRLSAFTNLTKYVAADTPLWRTGGIVGALAATDGYVRALAAGDAAGAAYEAVARQRGAAADVLAGLGEDEVEAERALRSALATIDLADSAIIAGTDQTGRIRGNRRSEMAAIAALEQDVIDPSDAQSTTAVLDKVSAAGVIRARQQQARLQLLTALNEQLLIDAKRTRDTEAAAMNMQLRRLLEGRAVAASLVAGSAQDFRTWRQP